MRHRLGLGPGFVWMVAQTASVLKTTVGPCWVVRCDDNRFGFGERFDSPADLIVRGLGKSRVRALQVWDDSGPG